MDFSRFIDCKKRKKREKFLLLSNSNLRNETNIKKFGYPITINKKSEDYSSLYDRNLVKFVRNNLINLDNENILKKISKSEKPEIIVDYTNDAFGEIKININFNKKLSKKRKKLEKKNNNNSSNILFIFFDNLSRVHFYRQYVKTSKFLRNFFKYEGYKQNQSKYLIKYMILLSWI
jgi:hypothetical protein